MKLPLLLTAAAFLAAGAYALTATTFQDKKGEDHTGHAHAAGGSMDEMPPWSMPGEQHKLLAAKAGRWSFKLKMTDPSMPPMESLGTSEMKLVLDGRFLEDTAKTTIMGMPFEGRGFAGYDRIKNKFLGTWADNTSTSLVWMEGTYDAGTKTLTYTCEMPDMNGKFVKSRIVEKMTDNDHFSSQFFKQGADGKEVSDMLIEYTRAK